MTTAMATDKEQKAIEWPSWLAEIASGYEAMNNESLLDSIRQRIDLTIENLTHFAVQLRIAEDRGLDVSVLPSNTMLPTLRKIAYGQVLPEIAQKFIGHSSVFRKITSLPIGEQKRVAGDEPVQVVIGDGSDHRMIRPSQMTPEQAQQVFASDHLRDLSEQRSYLERRAVRTPRTRPAGPYVIDKKKGIVRFTEPVEMTRRQLHELLMQLD